MTATCPGCGLQMPRSESAVYNGDYNASPECWSVYTEVLAAEYGNAPLFGRVHQLTVDSYAVQHAGGQHPDKSVGIHLCGLHFVLDRGVPPVSVPPLLQQLAARINRWPHFTPPAEKVSMTVFDIALAASIEEHAERVRTWATSVWNAWRMHHAAIAELVSP